MRLSSALDAQLINHLKGSGKENINHKPAIELTSKTAQSQGCFVRLLLHSRFKEMSGSILFFSFVEEAVKDRKLNHQKLQPYAVCFQFFGKLIQI